MIQQQITAKSVLSRVVNSVRLRMIDFQLRSSTREIEVIQMERRALEREEKQKHVAQVWLSAKKRQIERGV